MDDSSTQVLTGQASAFAGQVDSLFLFLIAITIIFSGAVVAALILFSFRYRRKKNSEVPEEIHGNTKLEIIWSVIPFVIAMVIFFWGASLFYQYAKVPADAMEILVTGKQWMWKVQHPTGKREINEIHVPIGKKVKITMTSEDVIHSLYLPAFRTKMDAVPGKYTSMWFEPNKTGKFYLFCAEYCGTEHSMMGGHIYVMEQDEYEAWAKDAASSDDPPEVAGQLHFNNLGCVACHGAVAGALGPSLNGLSGKERELADGTKVIADDDYIRESILNSQAKIVKGYQPIMPAFAGQIDETKLMQLVAYIKSLKEEKPAGGAE